ncbi:hypothetical protein CAPTEDRAFT_216520 [Capitella teleta]|uniref:Uncharacterized protein n=1 Tax=Capitella teleta TaxID=283909 RepID=R7UUV3_CAPTE|nr:hypothetical protein CAPTEDRAFT_216520 [Capitella teleta]|eukprot:ELU07156.1 hypothetical protein CAPTEDRAFT_216520 [Capitella teleta]
MTFFSDMIQPITVVFCRDLSFDDLIGLGFDQQHGYIEKEQKHHYDVKSSEKLADRRCCQIGYSDTINWEGKFAKKGFHFDLFLRNGGGGGVHQRGNMQHSFNHIGFVAGGNFLHPNRNHRETEHVGQQVLSDLGRLKSPGCGTGSEVAIAVGKHLRSGNPDKAKRATLFRGDLTGRTSLNPTVDLSVTSILLKQMESSESRPDGCSWSYWLPNLDRTQNILSCTLRIPHWRNVCDCEESVARTTRLGFAISEQHVHFGVPLRTRDAQSSLYAAVKSAFGPWAFHLSPKLQRGRNSCPEQSHAAFFRGRIRT